MGTMRVAKRQRFTTVNRELINDQRLSFRARGVLVWILDKPDDWQFDSESLAEQAKEGRDAIRAALRELADAGYIRRTKKRGEKGHWLTETVVFESPTGDGFPGVGQAGVGEPGPVLNTEPKTVTETPLTPQGAWERAFGLWWNDYPRKTGKPAALRAFKAKVGKMSTLAMSQMCQGTNRWLAHWVSAKTEMRYIPHPATFLNQERWNDAPPPIKGLPPRATNDREAITDRLIHIRATLVDPIPERREWWYGGGSHIVEELCRVDAMANIRQDDVRLLDFAMTGPQ